tara:strand:- start:1124 stop:1336 length:213 start_codon:yes stop_codon:yes gene_type:complete
MAKEEVLNTELKKDSKENKFIRAAQSVGNVKLNERREFEIIKDSKHLAKGTTVKLNAATEGLFRAKGLIK